jgi:hypothetical protein
MTSALSGSEDAGETNPPAAIKAAAAVQSTDRIIMVVSRV